MAQPRTITLKIKRQELAEAKPYWEEFHLPYRPYLNVISCLQDIQKNPKTFDGRRTTPVVWEQSCLEEVCGSFHLEELNKRPHVVLVEGLVHDFSCLFFFLC